MKKTIILTAILFILVISSTLAFFVWNSKSNQDIDVGLSLNGLDAYINYNKGTDVLTGTLLPSTDYTGGISTEIELWKSPIAEMMNIYGHIYLDITTIGTNLANELALKWAITSEGELLNFGDFVGQKTGDTVSLKINIPLKVEKQLFKIYIWLDESMDINQNIEGETLSTKVRAEATEITTIYSNYCKYNNITSFSECLIRSDSYTDYDTALLNIDSKTSKLDLTNLDTIEPTNYYEPLITEYNYDINSNSSMATTTNTTFSYVEEASVIYNGDNGTPQNISFNNTTYMYTFKNAKTGGIKDIITTEEDIKNGKYKYTCLNSTSNGNCQTLFLIYEYRYANDRYEFNKGYKYTNKNIGGTSVRTGLFKTVDDYSKDTNNDGEIDSNFTYFYRGDVENNWVEYANSLWRIIRINGNGSIRMIYSGSAEEGASHTGQYASIKNSKNSYSSTYSAVSPVTGKAYFQGSTYLGYMYNPEMVLVTTPSASLSSTNNLTKYPQQSLGATNKYYFFNSFNLNSNCGLEDGTCTMTCNNYDSNTGKGDNCIYSTYYDLASNPDNYDTSGVGSTTITYNYTNEYRYVCSTDSTTVTNGSVVTVKCPIVSEVLGVVKSDDGINKTNAIVRHHGLFSESLESSTSNVADSNIKYEVDNWYEKNILNKTDSSGDLLSDYLSDEIFCNDRTVTSGNGYNFDLGSVNNLFGSYYRNGSEKSPSLICINNNDKFTVNADKGNGDLDYPIALLTIDEAVLAGGKHGTPNYNYYLWTGQNYWTMSPSHFYTGSAYSYEWLVTFAGYLGGNIPSIADGIRPVVNLSPDVLYSSGTGTEDNPYKVSLN